MTAVERQAAQPADSVPLVRSPRRAKLLPLVSLLVAAWLSQGCAAVSALSMPGPSKDERVQVDMHRREVEKLLASSPTSLFDNKGMTEARYEYPDGPSGIAKTRALFYAAGDVVTLFIAELVFWPIELHAKKQIERVAVAEYSADDLLAGWTVRRKSGGETLYSARSNRYDEYVLAARGSPLPAPSPAGPSSPTPTPLVLPAGQNATQERPVLFAPAMVTTERETVEFEVSVSDTIREGSLLVDGRSVRAAANGTLVVSQAVPVGPSVIVLSAIDASGAERVQRVSVNRASKAGVQPGSLRLGSYHALVIGNDAYSSLPPLRTARADAEAVASLLRDRYGYQVDLLLDASRREIVSTIAGYRNRLGNDDNLLIYYAGHGIRDEFEDHGYWLPVDAEPDDPSQWIANANITRQLKAIAARHVLVIADSCYSGTLTRGIAVADRAPGYLQRLAERRSRTAMTSGGFEPVADGGAGAHSVFAGALLDELRGNGGLIEASELFVRLRRRVALASDQTPQYAPIVKAGHDDGEFLFVVP